MHKQKHYGPNLVSVADKHGDILTPVAAWERLNAERKDRDARCFRHPRPVQDFVEPRRPVDAPMATLDEDLSPGMGRLIGVLFIALISFMVGVMVGSAFL